MKHKVALTLVISLLVLALAVSPVLGITFGEPDQGEHPYVGLVYTVTNSFESVGCSGSLLSSTVLLTAAHCLEDAKFVFATFEETPNVNVLNAWFEKNLDMVIRGKDPKFKSLPLGWYYGKPTIHEEYTGLNPLDNAATYDIGVVVLNGSPAKINGFAELAPLGYLDGVNKQEARFTPVGYGFQSIKPVAEWDQSRHKGEQSLINLDSNLNDGFNAQFTNNPGQGNGQGGTCFVDSGGPILAQGTNTIVAINSFGLNQNCKGVDFAFRADISATSDFVNSFLP